MPSKDKKIFNENEARVIIEEAVSHMMPEGKLFVRLANWLGTGQSWARNRASMSSDQREITLFMSKPYSHRVDRWRDIRAVTNQTDIESLKGIGQHIDFYYKIWKEKDPPDLIVNKPESDEKGAEVWANKTFDRNVTENAAAVEELTRLSEVANLMSSGYIETTGCTALHYSRDEWGRVEWQWGQVTQAQCSVTVREARGNGSAWTGLTSFDIDRVDISRISTMALDRCRKTLDPVRIEPGRYQVIMEPQATATFMNLFMEVLERAEPEQRKGGPMLLGHDKSINRWRSKLGLKIVDERVNIFHDPADPIVGSHVAPLHRRVDFVKNGILTSMASDYLDRLNEISDIYPAFPTSSYTLQGGDVSINDMISSSKRALLVARFTQPEIVDVPSMLYSGFTRDGLWLIENGEITKSVRNFRWTESPLFIMNNIEQIGVEQQVFDPVTSRNPLGGSFFSLSLNNVVVPPLKVNDFSFTSTIDAI